MIRPLRKGLLSVLFTAIGASSSAQATVIINEAMPCNMGTYLDTMTYEYSQWIELYNDGDVAVDLKGYTIGYQESEEKSVRTHTIDHHCPIAPKNYQLFFFGKSSSKERHAGYKLDPDGGKMVLTNADGVTEDELNLPAQRTFASYGRWGDKTGYMEPTPGTANSQAYVATDQEALKATAQCDKPDFSQKAGVYADQDSLTIEISSKTPNASIYYTTDGSTPTAESGTPYTTPIGITATTVLKARAYSDSLISSPIRTASYILNDARHNNCQGVGILPIVSISTDRANFEDDTYGIAVEGTNGIGGACNNFGNFNHDWRRPVTFEYIVNGESELNQEVEVEMMGGCSRAYEMKSISLNSSKKCGSGKKKLKYAFFSDKPDNTKYKSLYLRNGGNGNARLMFRDGFMQSLIHGENIDYQSSQPVGYYINGEYQGMMMLCEHTTAGYVYSNYGLDEDEIDLIKLNNGFDVKEGSLDAYNHMVEEAQTGQNEPGYCEKMNELLDIDEYTTYMAFEQFIVNTDWVGTNTKLWRSRDNGRFRWILLDTDFGFGLYDYFSPNYTHYTTNMLQFCLGEGNAINWGNGSGTKYYKFDEESRWKTLLFKSLMADDDFKRKFLAKNLMLLGGRLQPDVVETKLDSILELVLPEYCATRYAKNFNTDNNVKTIRTFAKNRPEHVLSHLESYYGGEQTALKIVTNTPEGRFAMNGMRCDGATYDGKYISNNLLQLTAIAPEGYAFKYWKVGADSVVTTPTFSTQVAGNLNIEVVFDESDGVDNIDNTINIVKVYPNPVHDLLFVESTASNILSVVIYDNLGKVATFEPNSKVKAMVNMGCYAKGIYVVEVRTEEGVVRKKVVKG